MVVTIDKKKYVRMGSELFSLNPLPHAQATPKSSGRLPPCDVPEDDMSEHSPQASVQPASAPSRARKWLQLDKYDGVNMPFETFRAKLAVCAAYNQWSEDDQLSHLQISLTKDAAQCLWDVGPEKVSSLSALMDLLKLRFGSDNHRERFRVELRTRRQKPGESLRAVYQDIRRLLTLAFPGPSADVTEIIGRDSFLDSLFDQELALKAREREPKTLEEALNIVVRLEAYAIARTDDTISDGRLRQPRHARQASTLKVDETGNDNSLGLLVTEMQKMNQKLNSLSVATPAPGDFSNRVVATAAAMTERPSLPATHLPPISLLSNADSTRTRSMAGKRGPCYSCGQVGHLARACPHPNPSSSAQPTQPRRVSGSRSARGEDDVYLTATVGSFTGPCLVDTGCQLSLIPAKLVGSTPVEPISQRLVAANGTAIEVEGAVTVSIELNAHPTTARFLVTHDVSEIMLGMDFLAPRKCRWDFAASTLWLNETPLKLHAGPPGMKCRRVMVTDSVVLPPRTSTIISALSPVHRLSTSANDALLESHQLQPGLLVARTLLSGRSTRLPLSILNTTNESKVIRAGTCLGTLEQVNGPTQIIEGPLQEPSRSDVVSSAIRTVQTIPEVPGTMEATGSNLELQTAIEEMVAQTSSDLSELQRSQVRSLLWKFKDVLSLNDYDIGFTDLVSHSIDTGDHPPVREPLRQHPRAYMEELDAHVDRMLQQGIIEPCSSPWAANVVLVKKRDGTLRCAIDYRRLNQITKGDTYPLPRIDACLDTLQGSSWFSTLDLRSGYWQVRQNPVDADKTAFITRRGSFRFKVLSFGLSGAPSLFQRLMDLVLIGLTWNVALVYLDDMIIYASSFDEHISRLTSVLERLSAANLKVRPSKCNLLQRRVTFLGYVVSSEGLATDPEKIKAVQDWPTPASVTEIRAFVGLCSYYRKFISGFAQIAAPLHELTKKNARFRWSPSQEDAFQELKSRLTSAPILALPNDHDRFVLDADASDSAVGVVLSQIQQGREVAIAYASRRYSDTESRYCITRRELLAVIYGLRQFRQYLLGREFTIRTDHAPLLWLSHKSEPIGQQGRWLDFLAEFQFNIVHRPGLKHNNADALSRKPCRQCGRSDDVGVLNHPAEPPLRANAVLPNQSESPYIDSSADPLFGAQALREAQLKDPNLRSIITYLESGPDPPSLDAVRKESHDIKAYLAQWPFLTLKDGVLCRRFVDNHGLTQHVQLVAPSSHREELLRQVHSGMTGGHMGLKKTLNQLQRRAYWLGWRQEALRFCRRCSECATYFRGRPPHSGPMQEMVIGAPLDRVGIDLTGPHPRSRRGYTYILTYIDHFSKWAEAVPLRNSA